MLSFAGCQQVYLAPPWCKCARTLTAGAEQNEFGYVAEIKAASVGPAVFPNLVPYDIGLVVEAPCAHHWKTFGQ